MRDRSVSLAVLMGLLSFVLLIAGSLGGHLRAQPIPDFTPTVTVYAPLILHQHEQLTPTPTRFVVCTPPPCDFAGGEVYHCPDTCPGGCGVVCATVTPQPGPCECYADLYNCADFSTQADAPFVCARDLRFPSVHLGMLRDAPTNLLRPLLGPRPR